MTNQDFGRSSEARFVMEACARGMTVSRPFDSAPGYDCIVDHMGKLFRVQVKGTQSSGRTARKGITTRRHALMFTRAKSAGHHPCDVVAVWIHNINKWSFLPGHIARRKTFQMRLDGKGKYSHLDWGVFV